MYRCWCPIKSGKHMVDACQWLHRFDSKIKLATMCFLSCFPSWRCVFREDKRWFFGFYVVCTVIWFEVNIFLDKYLRNKLRPREVGRNLGFSSLKNKHIRKREFCVLRLEIYETTCAREAFVKDVSAISLRHSLKAFPHEKKKEELLETVQKCVEEQKKCNCKTNWKEKSKKIQKKNLFNRKISKRIFLDFSSDVPSQPGELVVDYVFLFCLL